MINPRLRGAATLLLTAMFFAGRSVPSMAVPAEIIVIRHGEKPKERSSKHLAPAGETRAKELVPYFKGNAELMQHGAPVALFATHTTKNGRGQRPGETLQPLAKNLGLRIQKPFESDRPADLAKLILSKKAYDQKTVVICWTHEFIPPLLEALDVRPVPAKLHENVYDRVYVITYDQGKAVLHELRQAMPSEPVRGKDD